MKNVNSLNHSRWECKYHITWIPKYRKKKIFGELRQYLGEVLRSLAKDRESEIIEGHLLADHVHILISIILVVGYMKGKSANNVGPGQRSFQIGRQSN